MTLALTEPSARARAGWGPVVICGGGLAPAGRSSPAAGVQTPASALTAARRAAGLTVTQVARALHVSRPTVSMWERGTGAVARQHWPALGSVLGLHLDEVASLFAAQPPARLDGVRLPSLGRARRAAGMSQRELAARVGVAPTTVSMWETAGVRVPQATVLQVTRILATELAQLAADPPSVPETRPLRGFRNRAGLSRREAAACLGIAVGTLSRYEAGERPTPVAVLQRMAVIYRRSPEQLLRLRQAVRPLPPGPRWAAEDVPAAIQTLRVAAGLTKVELGRALGRSGQAVRGWETGRARPSTSTCRRIERIFGLPTGKLPY